MKATKLTELPTKLSGRQGGRNTDYDQYVDDSYHQGTIYECDGDDKNQKRQLGILRHSSIARHGLGIESRRAADGTYLWQVRTPAQQAHADALATARAAKRAAKTTEQPTQ